jgi:hypothetical protein
MVDRHAVAQLKPLAHRNRDATVAVGVIVKVVLTEGINRERPIIVGVLVGQVLDIRMVIKYRNNKLLSATEPE